MILELEILEQMIEDEWTVSQVMQVMQQYDFQEKNLWTILHYHWHDGSIYFKNDHGELLTSWQVDTIFREQSLQCSMRVGVTEKGIALIG
jgi:hypothetical protein